MFCQNCGEQIPENAKFCNHCGAAQVSSAAQSSREEPQPQDPLPSQQPQQPNLAAEEKEFKKYVTPHTSRDAFATLLLIAVICMFVLPQMAVLYAAFAAIFAIPWAIGCNRVNKQISSMQSAGTYEKVLREFAGSSSSLDGKVRFSESYIFGKGTGRLFDYKDIEWIYMHNLSYLFIPIKSEVMIGNGAGKIVPFCKLKLGNGGNKEIEQLATLISEKNPAVLMGFGDENESEYKKRTQ